jgi:uncharacterized protein (DUF1778 family)
MYGNLPYIVGMGKTRATAIQVRPARTERIEARALREQKERVEYAASLRGISVSDFIIQNADAAAMQTIRDHESWTLNVAERDLFVNALLNPPAPNGRLRAAAQRYKARAKG